MAIEFLAEGNEPTLRKLAAWMFANAEFRKDGKAFGRVLVEYNFAAGNIVFAKITEETAIKNADDVPDGKRTRKPKST